MKYISGGIFILFFVILLYLLIHIWLEGRRERTNPHEITGETLPEELREAALRPLKLLKAYYEKRDPEQADACMDETMLTDNMLILGTNPNEIFHGREEARHLLQGDWRYWGQLTLDTEQTALFRAGSALYFVLRGIIRLDRFIFRLPIRITGTLEEQAGMWYISKLQFINNVNSNYVVGCWIAVLVMIISLLLFGLSWLF